MYKIKESPRARHVRIIIKPGGEIVVTKPRRVPLHLVEEFVRKNSDWINKKIELMKSRQASKPLPTRQEFLSGRAQALEIFERKVAQFNSFYKFSYKKISVRNNSSRLGSCSRRGNLSFSYSLINMPEEAVDYVVVHELCHLKEFNHSRRFWDLVGLTIYNYKEVRKKIRLG